MRPPGFYACKIHTSDMRREGLVAVFELHGLNEKDILLMQELSRTSFPRGENHQTYPKPKLGSGDNCKPNGDGNVFQRHSIYPVMGILWN